MRFTGISGKAVAFGGAAASMTGAGQGAIVHHNPADFVISGRARVSAYLDIQGGTISSASQPGFTDLIVTTGANGDSKPYAQISAIAGSAQVLAGQDTDALTMGPNTIVEPSGTYSDSPDMEMLQENNFYVGFRLDPSGPTPMYGWVLLNLVVGYTELPGTDDRAFDTITIREWAYENSGQSITTGAVPEASTSAMMAVLAGSAALYRRRERKTAVA